MSAIAKIYANACEYKGKNFNSVPASKQAEVREIIEADGFVILDDGTVEPATGGDNVNE